MTFRLKTILAAGVAAILAAPSAWPQDQDVPVVEELTAMRPMVPVPKVGEGAPYYSVEQLRREERQAGKNVNCLSAAARPGGILPAGDPATAAATDAALRRFDSADHFNYFDDIGNAFRDGLADRRVAAPERLIDEAERKPGGALAPRALLRVQSRERDIADEARRAQAATQRAEEVRRLAAQGKAAQSAVDAAELTRQKAVRAYDRAAARDFGPGYQALLQPNTDVQVAAARARIEDTAGGSMLRISGAVRNTSDRPVPLPDLTATVFDLAGNRVLASAARGSGAGLPPRGSILFEIKVPASQDSATVQLTVGLSAPFLGDRDFCGSRKPELAALAYWREQDDRRFNRPPPSARRAEAQPPFTVEILQ